MYAILHIFKKNGQDCYSRNLFPATSSHTLLLVSIDASFSFVIWLLFHHCNVHLDEKKQQDMFAE